MGIGRRKKTEILRQSIVDFENMQVLHRIDTARGIYFFEESQNIPPFFSPPLEEGRKFNVSVKRQAYGTLVGLICRATFLIEPCITDVEKYFIMILKKCISSYFIGTQLVILRKRSM